VTPDTLPGVTPEGTARTPSLALLISEPGSKTPRRLEFDKEEIVLGKDPICEVVLEDPKVSRRHARISISRGMIFLQDLRSTNGTYLNGHLIRGERSIASSDVIRIVDCMIRVVNMAVIDLGPTSVDIRRPLLGAVPDAGGPRRDTAITVTAMHRRPRPALATAGWMTSLAAEGRLYVVMAALAAAALLVALWL
jgi:pSer/pThr/pTyr-binding forkhead associated (FHA) protein